MGEPLKYFGINSIGLKRNNFSENIIRTIKKAYRVIYRSEHNILQAIKILDENSNSKLEVKKLLILLQIVIVESFKDLLIRIYSILICLSFVCSQDSLDKSLIIDYSNVTDREFQFSIGSNINRISDFSIDKYVSHNLNSFNKNINFESQSI